MRGVFDVAKKFDADECARFAQGVSAECARAIPKPLFPGLTGSEVTCVPNAPRTTDDLIYRRDMHEQEKELETRQIRRKRLQSVTNCNNLCPHPVAD
jgi:hypothetical protein